MPEDKKYSEQIYETLGQIDPEFSKETAFKDFEDGMQDNAYSKQIYDLLGQHDKSFTESVNLNDFSSEFKKKVQSQPSSKPVTLGYGSVAEIPSEKLANTSTSKLPSESVKDDLLKANSVPFSTGVKTEVNLPEILLPKNKTTPAHFADANKIKKLEETEKLKNESKSGNTTEDEANIYYKGAAFPKSQYVKAPDNNIIEKKPTSWGNLGQDLMTSLSGEATETASGAVKVLKDLSVNLNDALGTSNSDSPNWLESKGGQLVTSLNKANQWTQANSEANALPNTTAGRVVHEIGKALPMIATLTATGGESIAAKLAAKGITPTADAVINAASSPLTKYLTVTGGLKEYSKDDATLKSALGGAVEGFVSGMTLAGQMGLAGRLTESQIANLAINNKITQAVVQANNVGKVFAGTSVVENILNGQDIDLDKATEQYITGLAFELPHVVGSVGEKTEHQKIDGKVLQTIGTDNAIHNFLNADPEIINQANDAKGTHEDYQLKSLNNGVNAGNEDNLADKQAEHVAQITNQKISDIKFVTQKILEDKEGFLKKLDETKYTPEQKNAITQKVEQVYAENQPQEVAKRRINNEIKALQNKKSELENTETPEPIDNIKRDIELKQINEDIASKTKSLTDLITPKTDSETLSHEKKIKRIVDKIVNNKGEAKWSDEEIQFSQNHKEEVESELQKINKKNNDSQDNTGSQGDKTRISDLAGNETTLPESESQTLSQLRREGNNRLRRLEEQLLEISSRYGREADPRIYSGKDRQQWELLQTELQMVKAKISEVEYANNSNGYGERGIGSIDKNSETIGNKRANIEDETLEKQNDNRTGGAENSEKILSTNDNTQRENNEREPVVKGDPNVKTNDNPLDQKRNDNGANTTKNSATPQEINKTDNGKIKNDETQTEGRQGEDVLIAPTEEEKTALEKIATDNSVEGGFREVSNRIRKYVDPEMPFSEMTDEVYKQALKNKEEKPIEEKTDNEKGQIKKTVVTKRAYEGAFREDVKQELENIGLTREIETHEEAETKGNEIIDKLGIDTALEAVKKGDIEGAPAAHIYNAKLESINKEMLTEKDTSKLKELAKEQGKLLEILGNKALKSGQFSSYLGYIYEKSPLQYNLETQKQKYRDANNGVLPADVESRFEEYDKKLKEVTEKIQKAEERAKKAEDELAIKNIKAAAAKEKELGAKKKKDLEKAIEDLGSITIGSRSDKSSLVSEKARSSIRKAAHEFLTMKNQKFRDFIEVVEKKTGKLTDEEKDIFKKEFEDEQKVVEKTESTKSGIPKELIRNLVEEGIEDIDELTSAVMKDLGIEDTPENHRKTRDEITGYGKTSNPTKDALSKKISEMAGVGRLLSALEDVKKGLRSKRSGIQRRALIQRERELTKELRELTKDLPMDSADLAKYHKTALDAVKSRLKNRIEDLQAEIASRTKLNKNNKKVEYDTEANALVEERDELQKIHDEVFKDEGLTDEQRIKRALTAIENSHENYQHRIDTKQFIPIEKKPLPDDPRIIAAQVKLDAKKAEYEAAKLKEYPPKTQLEKDADALAKQIEAKEKTKQELIDKFNTGNLDVKKRTPQSYDNNPEIKLLNKQISDLNRMLAQRRNAAKLKRSPQQIATENAVKSAERELKSIEDMIASGNLIKVKKGSLVQQTAALKIAKDKLQMRREFLDDLREKAGIPEKIRVEKLKEAAKRSIDQNKERLNTGNFAKGRYEYKNGVMGKFKEYVKKETPDDEDLSSLLTEKAKWQKKFKREQEKVEQENRTKTEKIVDGFFNSILKVRGEFLLSNPKTLGKLLGSTIAGMIERGATEATGALSRFATKRIDAKADVEGGGWNGRALSDFYVKGIVKGLQDAKDFVSKSKGHESELDIIDKEQLSKQAEMKGFFGGIHQLEKSFLKRGTYEYALRKIVESKVKAKVDILDPLTTMQTMFEAMKEAEIIDAKERALEVAKKEILMGKNKANELFVSDPINKLKRLGTGGKLVASAYKYFFMFTRIGSNIMLETGKLGLGVPTSTAMRVSGIVKERLNGAENLSKALDSYIDKMTPEEANLIRELDKKGMVGISLFALGWFGAGSVGGLYVANDPDKEKQLKAGHIIINGYDIPSWWFHHPMFEIINIGATMHHLYDSYSKNNKEDNLPPIPHAALRTMGSFLSEDPFSKEHSALYETLESDNKAETFWGETVKSSVDPQLLQWWAKQQQGDIKLKPHTTGQYIKSGLPFWWQDVPPKESELGKVIKAQSEADKAKEKEHQAKEDEKHLVTDEEKTFREQFHKMKLDAKITKLEELKAEHGDQWHQLKQRYKKIGIISDDFEKEIHDLNKKQGTHIDLK